MQTVPLSSGIEHTLAPTSPNLTQCVNVETCLEHFYTHLLLVSLASSNSGETYCAVPTNVLARSADKKKDN